MKTTVTLLILFILFSLRTFAQNYTQWELPEGAIARFGKGEIHEIRYSPDDTRLAVAGSVGIWLYDTVSNQEVALLTGHTDQVSSLVYSPDGQTLASGSWDETIRLWDAVTGDHKRTLTGDTGRILSVAYSPDGQTLASGTWYDAIDLWDAVAGVHKHTLAEDVGGITSIAYSPDGQTLAIGTSDDIVDLWDVIAGEYKGTLIGHRRAVSSIAYSPDGQTLASGSWDYTIRLWDAGTGEHKITLIGHTERVKSLVFSPDGRTLTSSGGNTLRLWDAGTGEHKITLTGHTSEVSSIAYSPDGRTLASGSSDKTLRLWDAGTGEHTRTLTGHTKRITSVAYSPDGRTLASGSSDGTVLLWAIAPTTDPLRVADVNRDGVVNIFDLVRVGSNFGQKGQNDADINRDDVVDIFDLMLVASALSSEAAAPSAHLAALAGLTPAEVQNWLAQAQGLDLTDVISQKGVIFLENLLAVLPPQKTTLLANYPNPFNPETWMPYHLAQTSDVTLTIYSAKGVVVRQLDMGRQPAGFYTDRTKAAYWDGCNENGESVASGIYFYQLCAGDYTATRRMVIVK